MELYYNGIIKSDSPFEGTVMEVVRRILEIEDGDSSITAQNDPETGNGEIIVSETSWSWMEESLQELVLECSKIGVRLSGHLVYDGDCVGALLVKQHGVEDITREELGIRIASSDALIEELEARGYSVVAPHKIAAQETEFSCAVQVTV